MSFLTSILCRRGLAVWLAWSLVAEARGATVAEPSEFEPPPLTVTNVADYLGQWIWASQTMDKQTCRFWTTVVIPPGQRVKRARLLITVDNGFRLFLDGREIGQGSDWRTVDAYDLKAVLTPGTHVIGVEGFNDRLEAGVIFGLQVHLSGQPEINLRSDSSWRVASMTDSHWSTRKHAPKDWPTATVVGGVHQSPWANWPIAVTLEAPVQPLVIHYWQALWFQACLLFLLLVAVVGCVWFRFKLATQFRAQQLLQLERVRIARDIHDGLGSQLTQLVLCGEVMQREHPDDSPAHAQLNQLCLLGREVSLAMDEVVWTVNARRDTLRDFVSYVCKYAQNFLEATPIRCRLDVELGLPDTMFDLPVRRNLFLAVKEALNNAAKYSAAKELFLRIYRQGPNLVVEVEDNGQGFDPEKVDVERNGLTNMCHRMAEVGGNCELFAQTGSGCRLTFTVPLKDSSRRPWFFWRQPPSPDTPTDNI
jgi:signal transduction histidine kinase